MCNRAAICCPPVKRKQLTGDSAKQTAVVDLLRSVQVYMRSLSSFTR